MWQDYAHVQLLAAINLFDADAVRPTLGNKTSNAVPPMSAGMTRRGLTIPDVGVNASPCAANVLTANSTLTIPAASKRAA